MTDQMTPADLRATADLYERDFADAEPSRMDTALIDAARRLAAVLDIADDVIEHWRGHIDTHSESCWKWHAGCLARVLRDMEDQ